MAKRWVFFSPNKILQAEIASKLKISHLLAQVLINRGIIDVASAKSFLQPQIAALGDPSHLPDIEKASILEQVYQRDFPNLYFQKHF